MLQVTTDKQAADLSLAHHMEDDAKLQASQTTSRDQPHQDPNGMR